MSHQLGWQCRLLVGQASEDPGAFSYGSLSITDAYSVEEWRAAATALLASDFCRKHGRVLVDRRSASAPPTAFVETMTHLFSANRSALSGKRAAVLVADDAGFGMSRMTELISQLEAPELFIRTFRDYDTATEWLSRESDQ